MVQLITPNILEKKVRLNPPAPLKKRDPKVESRKYDKLKHPKDSVWNLPDIRESLWETVPLDDDLFKHAHYMDRNKSYRTTYGKMNEWMTMRGGRDMRSGVPLTMSDGNWQQMKQREGQPVDQKGVEEDFNSKFQRSYSDLTSKIAYRYPNPGLPRLRQGRIGGSWRHIKEVLGHGGSRVCYVDGLVGVYDEENFNQTLSTQGPYRPHLKRVLYSPNRGFISPSQAKPQESRYKDDHKSLDEFKYQPDLTSDCGVSCL